MNEETTVVTMLIIAGAMFYTYIWTLIPWIYSHITIGWTP